MNELPIIKNINVRQFITISEAKEIIEHLTLMVQIEEHRQAENEKERVLHIL